MGPGAGGTSCETETMYITYEVTGAAISTSGDSQVARMLSDEVAVSVVIVGGLEGAWKPVSPRVTYYTFE